MCRDWKFVSNVCCSQHSRILEGAVARENLMRVRRVREHVFGLLWQHRCAFSRLKGGLPC